MNTLVVYYSKFGHTRKVAESISRALISNGKARLVEAMDLEGRDYRDADLLIMGSPTHKMNLPEDLKGWFEQFPKKSLKGKNVAVFDTSYEMSNILAHFTAAKRLKSKLRKLGGKLIGKPQTFIVEGREGPLRESELERAAAWAVEIASLVP
jgi:flavodoxin